MVIAHRGKYEHSPFVENSIEALIDALKQPFIQGVELDVRMTKDQVLVIHHNATIDHTSDGKGILSTMTLSELYQYNFGTKKHPSKIATLKNFLDVIDTKKEILIELKNGIEDNQIYIKLKPIDNFIFGWHFLFPQLGEFLPPVGESVN